MNKILTEIQMLKIKAIQEKIYKLNIKLENMREKHQEKESEIIIKANWLFQKIELIKLGVE